MNNHNLHSDLELEWAPTALNEIFSRSDFLWLDAKPELDLPLSLLGLGRSDAPPLHKWEEKRNDWTFHIVWKGEGILYEADKAYRVKAPCIMLLRPFIWYRQEVSGDNPWRTIYCFNRSGGLQTNKLFDQLGLNQAVMLLYPNANSIQRIWNLLVRAAKKRIEDSERIDGHFTDMLDFILALASQVQRDHEINLITNTPFLLPPDPNLLGAFYPRCNVQIMAQRLGIPIASLHRAFAKAQLPTPADWLRNVRLEKAHKLLTTSSFLRISQIAAASGFKNEKTMNSLFKNRFGISPKQMQIKFRKLNHLQPEN